MKLHYIKVITRFLFSPRQLLSWIIVTTPHIPPLTPLADMDLCITEVFLKQGCKLFSKV